MKPSDRERLSNCGCNLRDFLSATPVLAALGAMPGIDMQLSIPARQKGVHQFVFDASRASSEDGGLKRSNEACSQNDLKTGER